MARATAAELPEVTEAHRRAAFEAMRWTGWTFEAAMADDTRRRVIEARAHQVRTQLWRSERHQCHSADALAFMVEGLRIAQRNARYTPHIGIDYGNPWPPTVQDLKRAAAGDLDD